MVNFVSHQPPMQCWHFGKHCQCLKLKVESLEGQTGWQFYIIIITLLLLLFLLLIIIIMFVLDVICDVVVD